MTHIEFNLPPQCTNCEFLINSVGAYCTGVVVARKEVHDESVDLASKDIRLSDNDQLAVSTATHTKIDALHIEADVQSKAGTKALTYLLSVAGKLCIGTTDPSHALPLPCRLAESEPNS